MMKGMPRVYLAVMILAGCSTAPKTEPVIQDSGTKASATAPVSESVDKPTTLFNAEKYNKLSEALRGSTGLNVQDEAAKILIADPNDITALNALAMWNYRQKKIGAAKLLLARAIQNGKPNAAVLNNYGLMLLSEGDEIAAAEQFKKALQINDGHAEANANLGAYYAKGGDWKKAIPRFERAWRSGRQDTAIANDYALALKATGETDKAKQIFEEAYKRNNKDPILLLNYAGLLIETLNRPKDGLALVYRVKFLETERKDVLNRATALERLASGTSTP